MQDRPSQQRLLQQKSDNPARYFFTEQEPTVNLKNWEAYTKSIQSTGIEGTVSLVVLPLKKDKIMLRIQNLADPFDKAEPEQVKVKDLTTYMA